MSVLKRDLPWLREFSNSLVDERIKEADLKWLRRREKSKAQRMEFLRRRPHVAPPLSSILVLGYVDNQASQQLITRKESTLWFDDYSKAIMGEYLRGLS